MNWKVTTIGSIILFLIIVASAQQVAIQKHYLEEHGDVFNDSTTLEANPTIYIYGVKK